MEPQSRGLFAWIDAHLPPTRLIQQRATRYYAPKNLNIWYYFGARIRRARSADRHGHL